METRYSEKTAGDGIERAVSDAVLAAAAGEEGGILVFLPGAGEIKTAELAIAQRPAVVRADIVQAIELVFDADQAVAGIAEGEGAAETVAHLFEQAVGVAEQQGVAVAILDPGQQAEGVEETLDVPPDMVRRGRENYVLRVQGNSMIDALVRWMISVKIST